jgi:hypothetical protein
MLHPRRLVLFAIVLVCSGSVRAETTDTPPPARSFAVRAGWAYGLGAELELRPGHWGAGVSGGFVPGLGFGGYAGLLWGGSLLGASGPVAELGVFRGVHNPLRVAPDGFGASVLGGYELAPTSSFSIRLVLGGGVPFSTQPSFPTFEFLAKLTAGVVF